ncbi:MAG: hypothetical protein LUF83_10820, partial [Alistipes sp.]|nr:hypothetical protein [Alistipes sp.]
MVKIPVWTQPTGLPINPQPRPVIVICRSVTIIGKCKTNILKIQIKVTIRKTSAENTGGPFIYIGIAQKGAKQLHRIKNGSPAGYPDGRTGTK